MSKHSLIARVREARSSGSDAVLLTAVLPAPLEEPLEGGHFFMLRTEQDDFPFLSRPFSVHDVQGAELQFLFKVVGPGTGCLARLRDGDRLSLVGPLGQPFPVASAGETSILVAGGVGLPPLHLYLRRLQQGQRAEAAVLLYGARSAGQLYELESAAACGAEVHTATEDGSAGFEGRVDRLLEQILDQRTGQRLRILTCGPDPMMHRVAAIARERSLPCHVSLETFMACGFGVCNACAVPWAATDGPSRYARACLDGPVFDAAAISWECSGSQPG